MWISGTKKIINRPSLKNAVFVVNSEQDIWQSHAKSKIENSLISFEDEIAWEIIFHVWTVNTFTRMFIKLNVWEEMYKHWDLIYFHNQRNTT